MARTYDLVLFGATGFTGRLVADYLAQHGKGLVWAVAGRNESKLREVLDGLGSAAKNVGLLVASAEDEGSLKKVATSTRVVCTTVGPFAKYGHGLARAAAQHVIARATMKLVSARATRQLVLAQTANHGVIAAKANQRVIACIA